MEPPGTRSTAAIIGLGNPGSEYDGTRHNIGFAVVDAIADTLNVALRANRSECIAGIAIVGGRELVLAKPMTYMNNSGIAVRDIVDRRGLRADQILIVVDDFQLPLGALRLRPAGSDGGHNGLYSIIYHLQTEEFPRLRCGIAGSSMPGDKATMARYVLSTFEPVEWKTVETMIERARDASLLAATEGIETAMNRFNAVRVSEN